MTSRGKSTPSLGVGLLITPRSTRARSPHSAIASISNWCDGRKGSTNAWNERLDEHEHGCEGSEKGNPSCSCIGGTVRYPDKTERHEPYESRGSRAGSVGAGGCDASGYPALHTYSQEERPEDQLMLARPNPIQLMFAGVTPKLAAALAMIIGILAFSCAPALAAEKYLLTGQFDGNEGPGGALSKPTAVAVDESTGDVYVLDSESHRVEKFDSKGKYLSELTGTATGAVANPVAVAVDNSAGPTKGDVYVADEGPNPDEGRQVVDQFSSTGVYLGQLTATGNESAGNSTSPGHISALATGPDGSLWVTIDTATVRRKGEAFSGEPYVYEFEATGEPTAPWKLVLKFHDGHGVGSGAGGEGDEPLGIALDSSGKVYLNHGTFNEGNIRGFLERWNISTSGSERTLTEDPLILPGEGGAIAVDRSTSDVFQLECRSEFIVCSIARYGPFGEPQEEEGSILIYTGVSPALPTPVTGPARRVLETTATITGEVNPQALSTTYLFQYGTSAEYGHSLPIIAAGEGGALVPEAAELKNLTPGTTYHYRIVASNVDGTVYGHDQTFSTKSFSPPTVTTSPAEGITQTSATLTGAIDPHELLTDYTFEVGGTTTYGYKIPGIIPGAAAQTVRLVLTNLVPETTYHYRIVASSEGGAGSGEDQTFTTGAPLFTPAVASIALVTPPPAKKATTTPKTLTKAQKLAKALKACAKKPKRQRAGCEKQARTKFGPAAKKKTKRK